MINFVKENVKWMKDERGMPACYLKIKIPSVSTILAEMVPDPEYDKWVADVGKETVEKIMNSAAQRGSAMHFFFLENFISVYSKTKDVSEALKFTQTETPKTLISENVPDDKIAEGRELFYKFYYSDYSSNYNNLLAIELPIYSASLFYRGKLDILYKDKLFGLSLTDFKSSNGKIKKGSVKEEKYKLQLGAYSQCIDEMYKEKNIIINRSSILCVDKKSEILQEIECVGKELQEYKEKFKTLVVDYYKKYNNEYLII